MHRFRGPILCLFLLSACASGAPRSSGEQRYDARVITADEVSESPARNAFELVQLLRPAWLQKKGAYSFGDDGDIVVYLDDVRMGGPDALRQIEVSALTGVRFLDAVSAQARFGLSHAHGAIQVISRRSR
ncbi:MAG: hypothetical protein JO040_03485 [Gemmatimonadetes bacterium]|nr:hypothetical protein [Gemmatimonadota bacterium]